MKTITKILTLAGLTGGLFAGAAVLAADAPTTDQAPATQVAPPSPAPDTAGQVIADQVPAVSGADAATNADPDAKTIKFSFVNAQLQAVLNYLSMAGGFIIHPEVSLSGQVTVTSEQPLSREEALQLVEHVLSDDGYAVIRDKNILTIKTITEATRSEIPVRKFTQMSDIPDNSEIATWIIPVRTLNPVALVTQLQRLIGSDSDLQANESANSLMITASQMVVRRVADIVTQLDSVSSSINSIEVFPLKYADAKELADLVKDLFPSQDSTGGRGGNQPGIQGLFGGGGRGGRGGGGGGFGGLAGALGGAFGGAGGGNANGSTPTSRVSAVSDDHSNSLIVSAPDDLIQIIRDLVGKLDTPIEDITEVKVFTLKNADCTEMANLLTTLFPDPNSSDATSRTPTFNLGGRGNARGGAAAAPGFGGAAATGGTESAYMKKLASVIAVPDPRTQSLLVSASKDLMPQIDEMISTLDEQSAGELHTYYLPLKNAEPTDVLTLLQDIYPQGQNSSRNNNSTQNNALASRLQNMIQTFNSSVSTLSTSTAGGGGGGGTRTGL